MSGMDWGRKKSWICVSFKLRTSCIQDFESLINLNKFSRSLMSISLFECLYAFASDFVLRLLNETRYSKDTHRECCSWQLNQHAVWQREKAAWQESFSKRLLKMLGGVRQLTTTERTHAVQQAAIKSPASRTTRPNIFACTIFYIINLQNHTLLDQREPLWD